MSWLIDVNNVEENWILDAVNNQVVITLTVEQQSAIYATRAEQAALQAELDVITTTENATQTNLDRTQTGLDVIATGADRVQTGLDRTATGLDVIATNADVIQTNLDKIATNADRVQTGLDRTQTGLDVIATGADRTQTGLDRTQTGLDRTQTGLDRIATGSDRVQTGLDVISSATSASNALASENAAELAASQILEKVDFTGAVEGDLYRVNSAGVAIPYKPPLSFENIRHKLAPIAYPDGALVFYDDFITGSGELNGRVSPTGQVWNTINLSNSATITGVFQVKKGSAVQESDTPLDAVATIPFTSSLNGIMMEGLFGKSSFNSTSMGFVIFNSVGDYILFYIDRNRIVIKRISGISTTLVTSPALNFPSEGVNASSIFNAKLSIIKTSETQYNVGFGANGLDFGYTITDAQAVNVLNSPSKIGFSGYRGYYSFGLRIIQGYRNFI